MIVTTFDQPQHQSQNRNIMLAFGGQLDSQPKLDNSLEGQILLSMLGFWQFKKKAHDQWLSKAHDQIERLLQKKS